VAENQAGITALLTAFARAYHATHDDPKIFDDFIADQLYTPEERAYFSKNLAASLSFLDPERAALCPDEASALAWYMRIQGGPVTLSRSRYTEDSLELAIRQGVRQYVILGAGMDTFAFRRPDLLKQIQVFEVDHPATQTLKRQRIEKLGLGIPSELHFVPIDFAKENLATALGRSVCDAHLPSFFSWLGVTYYLTRDVVFNTWRAITNIAPVGSSLVFDYFDLDAFVPERASQRMQRMQAIVRNVGEPIKTSLDPSKLDAELASAGLRVFENLNPAEIEQRYFAGRTDGYHAFEHVHFVWAKVAEH
jgi:methyltransferase (TIGR00027 family)